METKETYDELFEAIPETAFDEIHGDSNASLIAMMSFAVPFIPGLKEDERKLISLMPKMISSMVELYKKLVFLTKYAEREHVLNYLSRSSTHKSLKEFCEKQLKDAKEDTPYKIYNLIASNSEVDLKKAKSFSELLNWLDNKQDNPDKKYDFSYYVKPTSFSIFGHVDPVQMLSTLYKKVDDERKLHGYELKLTDQTSTLQRRPSLSSSDEN